MKKIWWVLMLVAALLGAAPIGLAQGGRQPITVDNAAQLVELIRLGRGTADSVAFSRDGQTVAVGSSVGVWLYSAADIGTAVEPPLIRTDKVVTGLAFAPDGKTLAINLGSEVQFWEFATQKKIGAITPARSSKAIAYSPDGTLLAINMGGGGISLWDLSAGAERLLIAGNIQGDAAVVFNADGSLLAGSTTDYNGHIWRVADGSEAATLTGHTRYVYDFLFSPDGSVVVSASYDKTVRLWDPASGAQMAVLAGTDAQPVGEAYSLAVSPDGMTLASGHAGGQVVYWDVNALAPRLIFGPGVGNILDLAFSPDGRMVATASNQPGVGLWDAASGAEVVQAVGHTTTITAATFSPDSTRLAISDYDKNIWLWDTAARQQLNFTVPVPGITYTGLRNDTLLAYAPDGSVLAAGEGFDVVLLDPASGAVLRKLNTCQGTLQSFAFSPDSTLLAEATSSGLCVSVVATGAQLAAFPAGDWLNTVAWSADQTLIATAGKDHTVRVYGLP